MSLSDRLLDALRVRDPDNAIEDDGETIVVRVDSVERRYRDAIKAGATPVKPPHDQVGMGAWRRVARLVDTPSDRAVMIWSDRG